MGRQVAAALIAHGFDEPIPSSLPVGRGTILCVRGWIARPRFDHFVVQLDDEVQRFAARGGELRDDVAGVDGVKVGFFLPIVIDARRAGTRARLRIRAGEELLVDQWIDFDDERRTIAIDSPIAICLATYNPDPALFARQLESIRAQSRPDWICIIHDDGSRLDRWAAIEDLAHRDTRFRVFRSERNRGFYRNFEAALALVPSATPYVALCDQDDAWYPDKLATCIARLDANPRTQLVYSDMRIVARDGRVVAPTYWDRRRNNYRNFDTLLFANTVTGAASVLRGSLLDAALPFPPPRGPSFHDHWLACAAFVAGGLDYIDRPLYDYTQHGDNVIGHASFGPLTSGARWCATRSTPSRCWSSRRARSTTCSRCWRIYHHGYQRTAAHRRDAAAALPRRRRLVARDVVALFDDRLPRAARAHAVAPCRGHAPRRHHRHGRVQARHGPPLAQDGRTGRFPRWWA